MVDVRRLPVGEDNREVTVTLDDFAREGASTGRRVGNHPARSVSQVLR